MLYTPLFKLFLLGLFSMQIKPVFAQDNEIRVLPQQGTQMTNPYPNFNAPRTLGSGNRKTSKQHTDSNPLDMNQYVAKRWAVDSSNESFDAKGFPSSTSTSSVTYRNHNDQSLTWKTITPYDSLHHNPERGAYGQRVSPSTLYRLKHGEDNTKYLRNANKQP